MNERRTNADGCSLCGSSITDATPEPAADGRFCSSGCRDIASALGTGDPDDETGTEPVYTVSEASDATRDDGESTRRTFLRVDGMHSSLCESFLERVAESLAGVLDAEASYVTETVRVDHDPGQTSETDLRDALSTLGYTAYLREEAADGDGREGTGGSTGGTRRSREMTGIRKRRADDVFEVRYIVGIVFGSFLLLPYVAILYPTYLSSVVAWGPLELYEDAFATVHGLVFLPVFFVLTGAVLYLTGMPLLRGAYVSLKLRRVSTHLLAALTVICAYLYGTLAFVVGSNHFYYDLTIVVAAVVMAAAYDQATVKRRAMDRLTDLTVSQVDEARLYDGSTETRTVQVEDLAPGDRVLVRHGERIPIDGTLVEGECTVDEAVVTGESLPVSKAAGDDVIGGAIVADGAAVVEVGEGTTSSIDRLRRNLWNLQSADHGAQRRADERASRVAPFVLAAAIVGGGWHAISGSDATLVTIAMAALLTVVVTSPWALDFATPVSVASSVRAALERGIVVFDETVFERLRGIDVVVFDKTGTVTTGEMTVLEADAPDGLLAKAAALEQRSSHPAATALVAAFGSPDPRRSDGGSAGDRRVSASDSESESDAGVAETVVRDFRTHATGVEGTVDGRRVLVGHPDLFEKRDWTLEDRLEARASDARANGRLPVLVGRDGVAEGLVVLGDEPRDGWNETVTNLGKRGIDVVVLTGDEEAATDFLRRHPHVEHVFAGVSPAGKTAAIRRLRADGRVAMVGDGTNDAPALATADLGISLGSGTALASDAADLAIVDDELGRVERAFALATAARRRTVQNLGLAFVYNAISIPLVLIGVLNPLFATVAVATCCLLVVANASRSFGEV